MKSKRNEKSFREIEAELQIMSNINDTTGSIYMKLFVSIVSILTLCFIAFGALLFTMISDFVANEKEAQLYNTATRVADMTTVLWNNHSASVEYSYVTYLNIFNESFSSHTVILDKEGKVVYSASGEDEAPQYTHLPKVYMDVIVSENGMTLQEDLAGFYPKEMYVVGVPIYDDNNEVIGAVLVATTLPLDSFANNIQGYYLISVLVILIVCCIATYAISMRIIRPLQKMSIAAKQFAKGNFDVTVPVTSNDEIGELATAMNNMASSLRNLDKMRNDFVANVSHDLRTPMTVIAGFIDGILDNTIKPEEHRKYLVIVRDEVLRLSRLVKNLLDIAKIEAGELQINNVVEFNICEMTSNILISFENAIYKKNIDVEVDFLSPQIYVLADYDSIFQVVYNLCENAVKFTSQDGYLKIKIMEQNGKASVSIKNSGEGITPDEMPRLFEKFYKSDRSRSLDKKGTGLGLYICKTIINRHGEDINVKSVAGEYTEFDFTLPMAQK